VAFELQITQRRYVEPCRSFAGFRGPHWSRAKLSQVFNLVTQQDATTSTAIAEETKADGAAMKTIAALTMVFLPGTFLASVFSMPMLEDAKLSLYVAIVVPLTVAVVGCWWLWLSGPRLFRQLMRKRHKVKDVQRMV
jgi:MFS-type transporter involved in bile tolerance (Atg22 family)